MERRIETYLRDLIDDDRLTFFQEVSRFADEEIAPNLLSWEREHSLVPDSAIAAMGEMGLFGLTIPEEHGGQGGSLTDLVLMGMALAFHSQSVAITPGAALSLGSNPIVRNGSDAQKAAHLPDLAEGKRMVVFGLSEPARGSDAANPEVTAVKSGDNWVIRGEKCWSTNAHWASHVVVHALTDPDGRPGHRSTCFLVPMDDANVHYNEMGGKMVWQQSSTGSISFDNVEVGEDTVIGEVNEGFKVMVTTLNGGRCFIAGLALGSLSGALERVLSYTQEREQFGGQPIARFQRVQDVLVDMDIALERGLTWLMHCVSLYDENRLAREQASKVKISCSSDASRLLVDAMEVCGGVACLDEFGLIRHHNDLFVCRVGEGSNRVLRTQVAQGLQPDIRKLLH